MPKIPQNIKELFSFTRGERIGVVVLIVILAVVVIYPYVAPKPKVENVAEFEKFKTQVDDFEKNKIDEISNEASDERRNFQPNAKSEKIERKSELFKFDPNTADEKTFMRLGFSQKQAASIIKYRSSGGIFRKPEDFKKMYVVSDEMFAQLSPFIKIEGGAGEGETRLQQSVAEQKTSTETVVAEKPKTKIYVEINSADTAELKKFRGIGSYYAKKIVQYRERLGGFANAAQLLEINGIDDERFAQFSEQIKINSTLIKRLKINEADEKALVMHPYINLNLARGILQYRKLSGNIRNVQQLVKEKIITDAQAEKLQPYIEF